MITNDKYLPLGSILMLKNGRHKVMVVGYCARLADEQNAKMYDYIGCLFPEGIFTTEQTLVFDHIDIEQIYHMGFVNQEVKEFNDKLNSLVAKINE